MMYSNRQSQNYLTVYIILYKSTSLSDSKNTVPDDES